MPGGGVRAAAVAVAAALLPLSAAVAPVAAADSPRNVLATATKAERQFLACVRERESGGNPRARNPRSSAAGLYQFLTATWQGNAKWARWRMGDR